VYYYQGNVHISPSIASIATLVISPNPLTESQPFTRLPSAAREPECFDAKPKTQNKDRIIYETALNMSFLLNNGCI